MTTESRKEDSQSQTSDGVLRQGQILESGFEILDVKDLDEFEAKGI